MEGGQRPLLLLVPLLRLLVGLVFQWRLWGLASRLGLTWGPGTSLLQVFMPGRTSGDKPKATSGDPVFTAHAAKYHSDWRIKHILTKES